MSHSARTLRRLKRHLGPVVCGLMVIACGVSVRADRGSIGGGPEQATEQARARFQSTIVAAATANAVTFIAGSAPCDCESSGK